MRKFNRYLLSALICVLFTASLFAQANKPYETTRIDGQEFYIYLVSQAEGFYSLTRQFNVTQEEIEKYNPETKIGLKQGQRLLIPVHPTQPLDKESSDEYFTHTVVTGETLNSLAEIYGISTSDIIGLNPGITENLIPGHSLKIPQPSKLYQRDNQYIYHTIAPKETLYSVAHKYDVSMQSIMNENSGLNTATFSTGKIIRIKPMTKADLAEEHVSAMPTTSYRVRKKETLYSISRKLDIKLSTLLELNPGITHIKTGDMLIVPLKAAPTAENENATSVETLQEMQNILDKASRIDKKPRISIAVLLPFQLNNVAPSQVRQNRYLEFYEGFLLAVDSMRHDGISIDLYVFDTATESIAQILQTTALKECDLIIGPATNDQIAMVADFAKTNSINMVNPFTFDSEATENNPHLFQLNTPNAYLYAESAIEFVKLFKDQRIVFMKELGFEPDKKDFIVYLQNELTRQEITYSMYEYNTAEQLTEADSILALNGPVVFVPLSAKKEVLNKLLPSLHIMQRANDSIAISLFGYPEWQMYTNEFMNYYYELNTYIYTRIYVNPFASDTKAFYDKFKYWYQKELLPIYPKYGVLGFDTGMFFLEAVNRFGKGFDSHIDMIPAQSIQTAMCFRRINNWSGFINRCIYFVNFKPNSTIEKIEVK